MKLEGKCALITGSSRGIGFAIAKAFVREGAKVAVCGSRMASAEKAVAQIKEIYPNAEVIPVAADMSNSEDIKKLINTVAEKLGRLDVLVNNAGVVTNQGILEMEDADFEDVIKINLVGPWMCTREAARVMKEQGGGAIVNTSSLVAMYGGKRQTAYACSKYGINGLTKSCAKELGPFGIRVNAVAPGAVATDMVAKAVTPQMKAAMNALTPLGRMADPDELAGAYVYLASDDASFTTGTIIQVDGGIVM
ncbi:MAG TPA: 3-oxoacyl-ACP reductase FabG [Methanocorpusculum sp.]|nr:3-oxoacyl-ACP reductase FabG [Methanocorpusculum sp.]